MRFICIDYGKKRIGLAMSDENNTIAFPKEVISNDKDAISEIGKILEQENIKNIVIGEPLGFFGKLNPISKDIAIFVAELQRVCEINIHTQNESFSSVGADSLFRNKQDFQISLASSRVKEKKNKKDDARAAALILQRFLDRYNHVGLNKR